MTSTINRLVLGAGVSLAGGVLCALALSSPAHADDGHAQRPGGALGAVVDLPTQAADRAQDVVDEVAPGPERTKPADEPKPTTPPADEPKPPTEDEPSEPPADVPPVEVPPVDVPPVVVDPPPVVVDVPPIVIDTPPVVLEPTPIPTLPAPIPTLPTQDPPTAPAAEPTLPVTLPTLPVVQPAALPTAVLPALVPPLPGLPILIGPTATPAAPIEPVRAHDELIVALTAEALCSDDLNAVHIDLRRIRIPLDLQHHTDKAATTTAASGQPCPGHPGQPDGPAVTALAVKPPPPTGEQLVADNVAGAYSTALQRLYQLRARGDLPAGRTQHPEPGPA